MPPRTTLCGARIGVYAHNGRSRGSKKNVATIGGVFRIGEEHFALTAAHAFYSDIGASDPWMDSGFFAATVDTVSSHRQRMPPNPRTYELYEIIIENYHQDLYNQKQPGSTVEVSIGIFVPAMGHRRTLSEHLDKAEIILDRDLDWALIELKDPQFWAPNVVSQSAEHVLTLQAPRVNQEPPDDEINIATGLSGIVTGPGLGTASGLMLPWSLHEVKAWSLECEIAVGDCGSLAFEPNTGEVYGMVIVHDPDTFLTYLVPALRLFDSIASQFPKIEPAIAELFNVNNEDSVTVQTRTFSADGSFPTGSELTKCDSGEKLLRSNSTVQFQSYQAEIEALTLRNAEGQSYIQIAKLKHWLLTKVDGYPRFAYLLDHAYEQEFVIPIQYSTVSEGDSPLLLTFALLLQHDLGHLLHNFSGADFTDRKLPLSLDDYSSMLNQDTAKAKLLWQAQWQYCPVIFELDRRWELSPRDVVPIHERKSINNKGARARVTQIVVLEEFVGPSLQKYLVKARYHPVSDDLGPRYLMAEKTYSASSENFFPLERRAFEIFRNTKGIIRCLGSYTQARQEQSDLSLARTSEYLSDRRECLVLEYGHLDLNEYFRSHSPPVLPSSIITFWQSLAVLAETVAHIHDVNLDRAGRSRELHGWHSDFKPDNILLVDDQFKLADPGLSRFEPLGTEMTTLPGGTVTYGAPEILLSSDVRPPVSQRSDVWSLGCVLSVAATWFVLGPSGVRQYSLFRHQATTNHNDSFHEALSEVRLWHGFLQTMTRKNDDVTVKILDLIDSRMLQVNPVRRGTASDVAMEMRSILRRAVKGDTLPPAVQRVMQEDFPSTNEPGITPKASCIGAGETSIRYDGGPEGSRTDNMKSTEPETESENRPTESKSLFMMSREPITDVKKARARLSQQTRPTWARRLRPPRRDAVLSKYIGRRHFIFLIDNAGSMEPYWDEMAILLDTLFQMLTGQDDDGIEVQIMSGKVSMKKKGWHEKDLKAFLSDGKMRPNKSIDVLTDPRPSLGNIVVDYIDLAKRSGLRAQALTVIVLTDGLWRGMTHTDALDDFFKSLESQLSRIPGVALKHRLVSFQFIQFGTDAMAAARLKHLDNDLPTLGVQDVIDFEPSTGDVYKMLLGSFVEAYDYADRVEAGSPDTSQAVDGDATGNTEGTVEVPNRAGG